MVYPNVESRSTAQQVTTTPELLGAIFIHLSIFDLLHVKQVCTRWHDCVRNLSELQPALYKRATLVKPGDNPHFKPLNQAIAAATSFDGPPLGELLLKIGHEFDQRLGSLVGPDTADGNTFDNQSGWLQKLDFYQTACFMINHSKYRDHERNTIMPKMGSLHCGKCHTFHLCFQWNDLHPLLRFLKDIPYLCIDGYNSTVAIRLRRPSLDWWEGIETRYQVFQNIMDLAEQLEDVDSICAKSGLQHDIGIQPSGLRLSVAVDQIDLDDRLHYYSTGTLRRSGLLIRDFLEGIMWGSRHLAITVQTDALTEIEPDALADAQVRVMAMNERIAMMEARSELWRQHAQRGTGRLGRRFGTL